MIVEELKAKSIEYIDSIPEIKGQVPSSMIIDFVIEKFKKRRSYPTHFSLEEIEADMEGNISTMAMAVVDIFAKVGAEGETRHQEKNITREYENAYISKSIFDDVFPYINSL